MMIAVEIAENADFVISGNRGESRTMRFRECESAPS